MQKGEALEVQIKCMLESEMQAGTLGLDPRNTQIFHRKAYFSKDRGSHIVFDVVIEVYRSGASNPWLVWVWECKNEGRPVAVAEVEEFASKLQQIGVHGVKGTVASRNGFQQGAIEYAKSKRIGLLRQRENGSIVRILQAEQAATNDAILLGLSSPDAKDLRSLTYGLASSGVGIDHFHDLVEIELSKFGRGEC